MNDFVTWSSLATYAGCTAAVAMITQFIKGIPALDKLPTQIVSYIVAVIVLLAAAYFTGTLTVEQAALTAINAIIVALASNGVYDAVSRTGKGGQDWM